MSVRCVHGRLWYRRCDACGTPPTTDADRRSLEVVGPAVGFNDAFERIRRHDPERYAALVRALTA